MTPNWYERHILPAAMDFACGMPMVGRMRQKVVPQAQGRVLEVGIGTGLNMRYYDKARVTHITGLDPALQLQPLARERIAAAGLSVDLVGLSAEKIPLPDASVQRWQERLQPLWGPMAGGCHLGRDIPALLRAAGFTLPDLQARYLKGPRPFTFHYWGEALAASRSIP